MDFDINIKRASLLSERNFPPDLQPTKDSNAPPDKFYVATLMAFFFGIATTIPLTFFITANDYWMYKFRDTNYENVNLNNKTKLQTLFVSSNLITSSVPNVLGVIITGLFSHKITIRNGFVSALGSISLIFIVFTILIKVNTDSWQTLFFGISLILIGAICFFLPYFGMSSISFLSKFPSRYMKANMFGTAMGGLFGSTLQIISLSIGNSSTNIALIYFVSGTIVMVFTFLLAYFMNYSPVVRHYYRDEEPEHRQNITWREYLESGKRIWPILLMMVMIIGTSGLAHPNITNLVMSEGYKENGTNLWSNKYFVATATYFMFDFSQLIGRFFAAPFVTKKNYKWFLALLALRTVVFMPLFIFCNAKPRTLPVWFPHDYQYMLIMFFYSVSMSTFMSIGILSISNLAEEKSGSAFMLIPAAMMVFGTITSPLNALYVSLLSST